MESVASCWGELPDGPARDVFLRLARDNGNIPCDVRLVCRGWARQVAGAWRTLRPADVEDVALWRARLGRMGSLRAIDFRRSGVTDATLEALRDLELTDLARLDVQCCENLTDVGLMALAALTGLTSLNVSWYNNVTDVGVAALAALTGLTELDVSGCDVTEAGVAALELALPRLTITWRAD